MTSNFNRSASSPELSAHQFQTDTESNETERKGGLRANKFSFSSLFRPVASRPQTPLTNSGSPSTAPWSSRVSSFVGSFFNWSEAKESGDDMSFTIEDVEPGQAVILSSPETVRVSSPLFMGTESSAASSTSSSPQEATLPQEGFFRAGDQERKTFVNKLTDKLNKAKAEQDPEEQLKKDIDRLSYLINGNKVKDVAAVKTFLGEAAESILPILSQTIPNTATDVIIESILEKAPLDTTHAELAMGGSKKDGTSISISKKEGSPNVHIQVETVGSPVVFLKKVEREGSPDFEMITLSNEGNDPVPPELSGEGRQVISLELIKDEDSGVYSLDCSQLLRSYQIKTAPAASGEKL